VSDDEAEPEAEMSPDEFRRRIAAPMDDREREETIALIRWFERRYPTPKARLAYARRKYREWTRYTGTRPVAGR
jgi:hypothetical protein